MDSISSFTKKYTDSGLEIIPTKRELKRELEKLSLTELDDKSWIQDTGQRSTTLKKVEEQSKIFSILRGEPQDSLPTSASFKRRVISKEDSELDQLCARISDVGELELEEIGFTVPPAPKVGYDIIRKGDGKYYLVPKIKLFE